jgi:hypothetical protein
MIVFLCHFQLEAIDKNGLLHSHLFDYLRVFDFGDLRESFELGVDHIYLLSSEGTLKLYSGNIHPE